MKTYIIYKQQPLLDGSKYNLYLTRTGDYSTSKHDARQFKVRRILDIILIVLKLILEFRTNYKYEKI